MSLNENYLSKSEYKFIPTFFPQCCSFIFCHTPKYLFFKKYTGENKNKQTSHKHLLPSSNQHRLFPMFTVFPHCLSSLHRSKPFLPLQKTVHLTASQNQTKKAQIFSFINLFVCFNSVTITVLSGCKVLHHGVRRYAFILQCKIKWKKFFLTTSKLLRIQQGENYPI